MRGPIDAGAPVPAGRDPWSRISCGHLLTGQNSDNEFCCRMATDVKRCGRAGLRYRSRWPEREGL
jgi:hypothetical protein